MRLVRIVMLEKFAHGLLAYDVQANGRFVEEEDPGPVQQGGNELHFHALAEAELAHHHVELLTHVEQFGEISYNLFEVLSSRFHR